MKIIGATKYTYIVEMNPSEVRQLCSGGVIADSQRGHMPSEVGRKFTIDAAWERLQKLKENRAGLDKIIGQFKAMGELLQPVVTELDRETEPNPEEEIL